ncbi:MAG TPA: M14 family zinc carboxypeptidase [Longimicrobiales bacterium]
MRSVPVRIAARRTRNVLTALLLLLLPAAARAQEPVDEAYTADIKRFTTEPFFLTPLVDHLPASSTVPTPLQVLGHIAGAADVLSYPEEIYRYMRAVDEASDRVKVFSIGETEEGREMILVVVADEQTLAELDRYKDMLARLADPRKTPEAEAQRLIRQAKPIYYATGAIHSPETGSPEMLMELVYRLAVGESEHIRAIRDNLIFMATPIVEVDGRAKVVDLHMARRKDPDANLPPRPLYWGKYVAHDNNRDGMGLSLALTQNVLKVYLEYHPTVLHDLHESASYLYTSTGRGPYNAWIDPILVNEWSRLAYKEVKDMTAFGVPGVYTHDFYDGWAPNYLFWIANMRNSIGRFYETQGAGDGSNRIVRTNVDRQWHRPSTPLPEVVWSIRNNVNLQQSALLIALREVADHREEYLSNFWLKSKRSVAKARTEGPAAYVMPASDPRPGQQAQLLSLLQRHGIEVHRATRAFEAGGREFPAGSYVVRMDQPYSRAADMLLDKQYYNPDDPRPYDDTGWTFGPLFNVETVRVEDTAILDAPMVLVEEPVRAPGRVENARGARVFLINYNGDNNLAAFRFRHRALAIEAAEQAFTHDGRAYNAGSFIVPASPEAVQVLQAAAPEFGFTAYGASSPPAVPTHPVAAPRIAVMHTWQTTQNEGWVRIAFDEYGIPYDYISVHDVRDDPRLADRYDVIVFGPSLNDALSIVRGLTGPKPIPWKRTELTPNIGRQAETDDMRGGLELTGVLHLQEFVKAGGTFITLTNSSALPVHFGLADGVRIRETEDLWAPGGVFRVTLADSLSPIAYGYGTELGVYFDEGPVFALGAAGRGGRGRFGAQAAAPRRTEDGSTTARRSGRGGLDEEDIVQGRPRDMGRAAVEEFRRTREEQGEPAGFGAQQALTANVRTIFRFSPDVKELLISGGLMNGHELANAPALVDVKLGGGHVVLFSFNPMWRGETLGSYALVFNTLLHHGHLDVGRERPAEAMTEAAGR